MGVLQVTATIDCDGCEERFSVDMPTYKRLERGTTLLEWVIERVGNGCVKSVGSGALRPGMSSLRDGKMLCPTCTSPPKAARKKQRMTSV